MVNGPEFTADARTPQPRRLVEAHARSAITLNFILSGGDTASFSTALGGVGVPVPAPGALALLASAGLVARRRRR
jgi:hypothetical protein